ncbi:RimJ/RimL family protein N-acetyltransferase [Bacillus pakistanensis]|uniref:RimJ/RimL family protein N-acetyltransferase n=1 Tax=Rossellomorea pakistanensis TaxID=992288 RepID=A0ABS2NH71_9BACI|nr:GNAT family N-acetyltransferase [Bacillus pakistanensis]MBM7587180.1 RimJ/RimL family protein N-acetyltransferase [Bacillus pakistanensis]
MNPLLFTERLSIRPFQLDDASRVQELLGAGEIAETTTIIPHPLPDGFAEEWINKIQISMINKDSIHFALVNNQNILIGCIYLFLNKKHNKGELGYWLGKPYWNKGYCTEAGKEMIKFGFEELGLNRIYADAFTKNTASSKVMQKVGLKYEGTFKQSCLYRGVYEDTVIYGITRDDYFGL